MKAFLFDLEIRSQTLNPRGGQALALRLLAQYPSPHLSYLPLSAARVSFHWKLIGFLFDLEMRAQALNPRNAQALRFPLLGQHSFLPFHLLPLSRRFSREK